MPEHISTPTRIPVPGGKVIEEFVGRVQTGTASVSVAHMVAPPGWDEPFQTPTFDEVTVVLRGTVRALTGLIALVRPVTRATVAAILARGT